MVLATPAHAAPPSSQAVVSHSALAPAGVVPNLGGTNCIAMTLSVQTHGAGGAVQITLSFKNTCFVPVSHVTWYLNNTHQCSAVYAGNVHANGGLGATVVPVAGSVTLLANQVFPSSCEIVQTKYLLYTMSVTAHVDCLDANDLSVSAYGQITVSGTYH
jgi:hypothetical protein